MASDEREARDERSSNPAVRAKKIVSIRGPSAYGFLLRTLAIVVS